MSDVTQESTGPRYPEAKPKLVGEDGNAWAIMARVSTALKQAGVEKAEIDEYIEESMSGDYNNLLRTAMRWCDCDGELDELLWDEN